MSACHSQRENAQWVLTRVAHASEPQLNGVSRIRHSTLFSSSAAAAVAPRAEPVPESETTSAILHFVVVALVLITFFLG